MKTRTVKVDKYGTSRRYLGGKLHREDGPAIENVNGDKEWFFNNKRHRTDGPAIEYADGDKEWFVNGEELTRKQFNKRIKKN